VRCRPGTAATIALIRSNGPFPIYPPKTVVSEDDRPYFNDIATLPPPVLKKGKDKTSPYREYTVLVGGRTRGLGRGGSLWGGSTGDQKQRHEQGERGKSMHTELLAA
jgi:hypothetical protein